jgi:hypothetical protein
MNPRHATALALLGWYLMTPPLRAGKPMGADAIGPEAPLRLCQNMGSFDGAADCYQYMQFVTERHDAGKSADGGNLSADLKAEFQAEDSHAVCVATDDPNLKDN